MSFAFPYYLLGALNSLRVFRGFRMTRNYRTQRAMSIPRQRIFTSSYCYCLLPAGAKKCKLQPSLGGTLQLVPQLDANLVTYTSNALDGFRTSELWKSRWAVYANWYKFKCVCIEHRANGFGFLVPACF